MCNSSLNWGNHHRVNGCVSSAVQTTSIYDFQMRQCTKLTGPCVSLQLSEQGQNQNEMASQLIPGSWVAFKSTGDVDQIIWVGRAISKPEWDNCCVFFNDSSGRNNIDGAAVGRNGYAINVQWYIQKVVDMLEFIIDKTNCAEQ